MTELRENNAVHIPVMLKEAIQFLDVKPDGIYLDCTVGMGGHSSEILKVLVKGKGMLYGIDRDEESLIPARKRLLEIDPDEKHFRLIHTKFSRLKDELGKLGIKPKRLDGILFDLGVSSPHYDNPWRGFTYRYDVPLDMRMDLSENFSAYDVVNKYRIIDLETIFRDYGDEKYAELIAYKIYAYRELKKPIETTQELERVIIDGLPPEERRKRKHPAQKCFQAIRMEVNEEILEIEKGLRQALEMMAYNGHLVVITFHSLEDKTVKKILKEYTDFEGDRINDFRLPKDYILPEFVMERKKVIYPSQEEVERNPRARSSKLRAVKRIERLY